MLQDFFKLALNNLRRRKLRSWLTMIGIFIGIAAVVSLITLGQGLQTAVTGQFATLSTDKLTIQNAGTGFGPPGSTVIEKLNEHDVKVIKKVRGLSQVITRLIRVVSMEYNSQTEYVYVGDISENEKEADTIYESMGLKINEGRLLKSGDSGKVVLGSNLVKKSKFGKKIELGKDVIIQGGSFEVVGILKKGSSFQINDVVVMMNNDMEKLLDIDDEIDMIIAEVENPDEIAEIADAIEKEMRSDRNLELGKEDFSVQTPLEAISAVNDILTAINVIVIGIAMISLLVGGVGIANTMYTSVLERKKEIGTMKAIGAKNEDILKIFLIEAGLLGLVGGIIGALIGISASVGITYYANQFFGSTIIQVNISLPLIFSAITFSFLVGLISGLIPSIQASKLKPVDALRG